jgi:hypothetical protein
MDYLGHSILSLQSSGGGDSAAIAVLQEEVAFLQNETRLLEDEMTAVQEQIASSNGRITSLQNDISALNNTVSANLDYGSIVLTCPPVATVATKSVPLQSQFSSMYYYGYHPNNSTLFFSQVLGGNFDNGDTNPFGLVWTRPTASQSPVAIFEVDALTRFIPSAPMYVKLAVKVYRSVFDPSQVYEIDLNERPFAQSTAIVTWSTRSLISVPLTFAEVFVQNVTFTVQMRSNSTDQTIVYGVGGEYGMQHNLIVKRIQ